MQKFLNILAIVFLALSIFYIFKLDFSTEIFGEENQAFSISLAISIIGLLVSIIMIQAQKIRR